MGAREGMIVSSALLAICFLASAATRALEPVQPGSGPSSAPSLPAFLDDDRLPALEEAWHASEQPPQTISQSAPQLALPAETSPVSEPTAASDEPATTVRQRAEDLSRRFDAANGPAATTPPPSVTIPPAVVPEPAHPETRPESKQAAVTPAMPPEKTGAIAPSTTAFAAERLRLAAPPPSPETIPSLPRRAPKNRSDAGATVKKAAVTRLRPTRTYSATAGVNPANPPSDPKAALRGTIMTNELRSFGWNTQPK